MSKRPVSVEQYITSMPKATQPQLRQLRATIKKAAPKAVERISYGMPYYDFFGRLIYFRLSAKHIGIYIPTPTLAQHKNDLKKYSTSHATVRFPLSEKLPVALIRKLVKSRMTYNVAHAKKKQSA